jgi:hypothetical protein
VSVWTINLGVGKVCGVKRGALLRYHGTLIWPATLFVVLTGSGPSEPVDYLPDSARSWLEDVLPIFYIGIDNAVISWALFFRSGLALRWRGRVKTGFVESVD